MGARPAGLLLTLALLAPLAPAGADERAPYGGRASTCDVLRQVSNAEVGSPCPWVRQEGVLEAGACAGASCAVRAAGLAEGGGVPAVRKTLSIEVLAGGVPRATLCAADAAGPTLSCAGAAEATFALLPGECRPLRVRATLVEVADVPPTLPVRTDAGFQACREGDALRLS